MSESRVILVEDDDATRAHLCNAVDSQSDLRLVGAANSCASAREILGKAEPDVFLTDLGLPDGHGIELIALVRKKHPKALIMVVTIFGDEQSLFASLEAGASGYLLKDGTHEEIGRSIVDLIRGGSPMSAPIARHLLHRFRDWQRAPEPSGRVRSAVEVPDLTARESEVLGYVAKGFTYAEIAKLLGISGHTVTTHVRHIYEKLEVGSRSAAVYEAVNLGLIRLDE